MSLNNDLRGLKDLHNWYQSIDKTLFIKKDKHDIILVQVYVDDIIFRSTKKSWCDEFKALMKSRFSDEVQGRCSLTYLGLQVKQKADVSFISHSKVYHRRAVNRILGNPQQEVVNFFAGDSFLGNVKSRPLWLLLLQRQNMLLLQAIVGKFCGFKNQIESLRRVIDGTEALLLPTLFILWLETVSTDSAKLVPLGKVCTAIETLKKNTAKALISLSTTITLSNTMAVLESCPKHNMVAYLEKTEGNAEFHEIIDFLTRSSIHHALTVSLVVSTTFVEQFWTSAKVNISSGESPPLLFASMLVQPIEDEGAPSERPSEAQPTPSPTHTSKVPVSDQAKEIQCLQAQIKKLKKQAKPVVKHHRAWMKSVSLKQRLTRKRSLKKQWVHKEYVSKQGRKFAKGEPSVHKDLLFDEVPEDTLDYIETEVAQDVGRTRDVVDEENENDEDVLSTKDKDSTDGQNEGTDDQNEGTDDQNEGTDEQSKAKAVSIEKEKGVEFKDIEETKRPKPTSIRSLLTLKPLLKIDPKDKGKKKIEEEDKSENESDGIPEAEKKFKQLASDKEMARKARIEADRLLAEKLQEEEREQFTIEERAKFLHDTIAAQRKFLAQQRSEAIRNRPPTKNQLRNQMMTYLKHVGNFKHSELKTKKFEEIQALYEKIKRSDEDFISIGSAEDERLIKKMNEKGIDSSKNEMVKEESKEEVKEESKEEESNRKRKLGTRKKMKSRKIRFTQNTSEDDSEKENDELRLHLTIAPDEEKEVDYEILDRKYPIKEWKTECLGTKPQVDKAEHLEEINQNVVIRSNGQKRYFSTLMMVLSIFDRDYLNTIYQLVMDKYQDEIPRGFDRVLWGDLMVMFNPDDEDKLEATWKKVLLQMLELKLESEEDSTMALELIRFVKKILAELEPEDSNRDEEDL
ncbi:putative ribonuclease H-like domain-containing protein [Tanacetum coccineum]